MAKKYYWLRLKEDFFKSLQMKKLRKIAGGETFTIIYLKMQLLSLRDEGYLYFEGVESSLADELALELDEEVENVKITLSYLQSVGLLQQIDESSYLLTDVPVMIGKETDKAQMMRKSRAEKNKNLIENGNNVTQIGNNVTTVLPSVTKRYTEIEIDIEKEKEIDREIDIEKEKRERINYQEIVDMYNDTCVSFPRVTTISDARKKAISARLKTYTIEDFEQTFKKAESSSFLKGKNERNWSANFDWMIKDANMAKILDGNYDNRQAKSTPTYKPRGSAEELDDFYKMCQNWAGDDSNGLE